jgi:uncharacterized protein YbjT (DUF2867 family)
MPRTDVATPADAPGAANCRARAAPGTGDQRLNPIAVADVALALAAAATRGREVRGCWELGGPEVVTFDEFLDRAIGPKWKIHLRRIPGIPAALTEVYGGDALADPREAAREFALTLTPLAGALTAADG